MLKKVPGKGRPGEADRRVELMDMFPDDATAEAWFESAIWPKGRHCPHCGNADTKAMKNRKPMPYWCGGCQSYFSVRTGT